MNFFRQNIVLIMIERQSFNFTNAIKIRIDIFGAFYHEDFLAILHLGLNHYLRMQVNDLIVDFIVLIDNSRMDLELFLAAKGNVVYCHKLVFIVNDAEANKDLRLVFVPILNF